MACDGRALSRHSAMLEVWAVKSCQVVPGGLLGGLGPAGEPWLDIELAYEVQEPDLVSRFVREKDTTRRGALNFW